MSDLKTAALEYHAHPRPGKLSVELTKATATARDLSLAYSPGVAEPVREIARDPELAYKYTGKGNLVAVISDGTAILGLGNLGPLASKPVMEGKGVLFSASPASTFSTSKSTPKARKPSSTPSSASPSPLVASTWKTSRRLSALRSNVL
jgi:hypothetical protein